MAVTLGNPIIVPAADVSATPIIAWTANVSRPLRIAGVRWVGFTTDAHEAIIKDVAGNVKWTSKAATLNVGVPEESVIPFVTRGLVVETLDSGTLYIYQAEDM